MVERKLLDGQWAGPRALFLSFPAATCLLVSAGPDLQVDWGLRYCISNLLPGIVDVALPRTSL